MTPRKPLPPPLDPVAEALVLADPVDIASLEELDVRVAKLDAWAAKHAPADAQQAAHKMREAVRNLRRDPELGQRALETIGNLFYSVDAMLSTAMSDATSADSEDAPEKSTPAGSEEAPPPGPVPSAAPQLHEDPELIADFVTRANEHLESAEEHLILLEKHPGDREALNATFRAFHTIKGMAGFLSFEEVSSLAHSAESVLDDPRHGRGHLGPAASQQLFTAIDTLRALVAKVDRHAQPDEAQDSADASASPAHEKTAPGSEPEDYGRRADDWRPDSVAPQQQVTRSVRVDEDRLDRLVDSIGELVIAESMVSEAAKELGGAWSVLAQRFGRLDKITRRLQEMATSLRMVPLKSTFRRMARLARDTSASVGKPVEFVLEGEETELDKEMVDRIADPLTHLVRNAVDHGLEPAEQREMAGKPATGRVELRAFHRGGTVNIEVVDDGRGMDPAKILAIAREKGFVAEQETPTDREVLQLIFEPGFTTAESVTSLSGRGVGMDVVKAVVQSLRGFVEVFSEPGRGTRFTIRLPLTLAIIEGMVLRVAEERYILPLTAIERSVRPTPDQVVTTLGGRGEMLDVEGRLVPILRLDALFDVPGAEQDPGRAVVVIVNEAGLRVGLLACELLGQQQTVIKPLGDAFQGMPGLSGGAIMPDGRVGLILDPAGLVELANRERGGE